MYYVIFDPKSKYPSMLENDEGGIAGFPSWEEANEEAKTFSLDDEANDYIIVGECTEERHEIVCSNPVNPSIQ